MKFRKKRISTEEAAKLLGMNVKTLRKAMQQQKICIGLCLKIYERYTYSIDPLLLSKVLNISVDELANRVKELRKR